MEASECIWPRCSAPDPCQLVSGVTDADVYVAVLFFAGLSDKAAHGKMRSHFLRPSIRIFSGQLTNRQSFIHTIRRLTILLASLPVFRGGGLGLLGSLLCGRLGLTFGFFLALTENNGRRQ